jgi:hypothetical protein
MKRLLIAIAVLVLPFGLFASGGELFKQGVKLIYKDGKYYQNSVKIAPETAEIALQYYNKYSADSMESARSARGASGTLLVVGNTVLMFGVTSVLCGTFLDALPATIAGAGISTLAAILDIVALVLVMNSENNIEDAVDEYNGSLDKSLNIEFKSINTQTYGFLVGTNF